MKLYSILQIQILYPFELPCVRFFFIFNFFLFYKESQVNTWLVVIVGAKNEKKKKKLVRGFIFQCYLRECVVCSITCLTLSLVCVCLFLKKKKKEWIIVPHYLRKCVMCSIICPTLS